MLKNKKILITGATGFVGANLARYFLKESARVFIFTRRTSDTWRINDILRDIYGYSVDLKDPAGLKKTIRKIRPDVIIHSAVYGGYPFQKDIPDIVDTNFTGTVNLIDACTAIDFELFINTGSSSEYGIKSRPMEEGDILEPVNEYGASKAAAFSYCHRAAKKENKPVVTLRLFSPYGYYEEGSRLIPSVILSCLRHENPGLSSPDHVRDFIFIEDVITAYRKAIDNKDKVKGEVFNIGSGIQSTVGETVKGIIRLAGDKVRPEWGKVDNARQEPECWQADISKARALLDWEPEYSLIEGLKEDIDWFRRNINLYK